MRCLQAAPLFLWMPPLRRKMLQDSPELPQILERMVDLYTELGNRLIANELLIAKLMTELAQRSDSPDDYMMRLTGEISGLTDRLAGVTKSLGGPHYDPAQITSYVYRLCDMAEDLKNK